MLALLGLSRRGVPAPRVSSRSSWGQALRQDVGGRGSRLPPKAWGLGHFDLKVGREPGGAEAPGRHAASRDAEAEPRGARLPPGTLPTAPPLGASAALRPRQVTPCRRSSCSWLGRNTKLDPLLPPHIEKPGAPSPRLLPSTSGSRRSRALTQTLSHLS